jgi:hypothetical protein
VQHGELGRWFKVFVARSLLDLVLVSRGVERGGVDLVEEEKEEQSRPLRFTMGGSFSLDAEYLVEESLDKLDGEWFNTGMENGRK